ncbi:hypothetical protein IFM89_001390 [Coptis chinensis]|uniref:Reverse transcriptase domain-containing protein n=1 Tax=Coptis chinensis TaxID=261450 RepID=A0A835LQT3_9MAGN|nr:hypothetical protein IFM89_001390 [Coptis chinensis]
MKSFLKPTLGMICLRLSTLKFKDTMIFLSNRLLTGVRNLALTGAILTERRQIGDRLTEFFATLMTTSEPSFDSKILNVETPVLSTEDLLCLAKPIDNKEILFALKQMRPFKAPGPDGFQAIFFHHFWHLVGPQIDMQKAFDKLEWSFLRIVLSKFGFPIDWINRIMFCVEKVSYSILLNGAAHGFFKPTRGLRQGDPLSLEIMSLLQNFEEFRIFGATEGGNSSLDCFASHVASLALSIRGEHTRSQKTLLGL